MDVFTNIDIKTTRKALKMSAADLAEAIGSDVTTIYNYERGQSNPDPDVMYQIAMALGDINIWHRWMRTKYPSYARIHPANNGYDLRSAVMVLGKELQDVMDMMQELIFDAASGSVDDPELRKKMRREGQEAIAALANVLMRLDG